MGHWAKIDSNNIVQEVIVITEEMLDTGDWGDKSSFVKTSYNTKEGKHYVPKENQDYSEESADQSKALRFRYAGPGMYYDSVNDVFYKPRPNDRNGNPSNSWTLNTTTWKYEPPIECPTLSILQEAAEFMYYWDETIYQSDNTKGWMLMDKDLNNITDANQDGVAD